MTRQTYDRAPRLTKLATAHISKGDCALLPEEIAMIALPGPTRWCKVEGGMAVYKAAKLYGICERTLRVAYLLALPVTKSGPSTKTTSQ